MSSARAGSPLQPALLAGLAALLVSAGCALAASTTAADQYYSPADFSRVEKIDAHVHIHGSGDRFMAQAMADHMHILTINVDYPDFPALPEQQRDAVALKRRYPGRAAFAGAFSVENFESPGWADQALEQVDRAVKQGAVGIKIWKNIGMSLRDPDGRYVMLDDPRFAPVFSRMERDHIVLLGHQAEPLNCWLPYDQMTVRSDRDYFREHPQYYMYQHPEMPSHDTILAARDRMLQDPSRTALRCGAPCFAGVGHGQSGGFSRPLSQRQRRPGRPPGASRISGGAASRQGAAIPDPLPGSDSVRQR